jgi:hypothetical protein
VKAVDTLLGDHGDAAIFAGAVDSLKWWVHCSAVQDKGQAHIIKRGLAVVPGQWSWVCYPEVIEIEDRDQDRRLGDGADDANGGEDDADRGYEVRVAN